MKITCPKCSKVLNVPANLAGQVVKCPCGQQMKIANPPKEKANQPSEPITATLATKPNDPANSFQPPATFQSRTSHSLTQNRETKQALQIDNRPVRRCRRCKGEIHATATVCPHCRMWQNPQQYWANFTSIWVLLMAVVFGIPLIIGFGFVMVIIVMYIAAVVVAAS